MRGILCARLLSIGILLVLGAGPAHASDATRAFARGLRAFEAGSLVEAEGAFGEAARADPGWARAHHHLGLTRARLGDSAGAERALEAAEAVDPDLPGLQLGLGIARYENGRYAEAESALLRAVQADAEDGSAHFFLGLTRQQLDRHGEAVAHFDRAAAVDPTYRQLALYQAGISHRAAGDPEAAREAFEAAIEADPASDTAAGARRLLVAPRTREGADKWWSVSSRMGMEVDDNVTVPELDASSGESDVAGVFELGGSARFLRTDHYEAELRYDFYQSVYADLSSADLQSHTVGLSGTREFDAVDANLAWHFNTSTRGGDDFLDLHSANPSLGWAFAPRWYATLGYEYRDKNFAVDDRRDAGNHGFGIDVLYLTGDGRSSISGGYRLESEDARAAEFDYLGHGLGLRYRARVPVWTDLGLELGYRLELRDYGDVTPSIGEKREDDRHRVTFALEHPMFRYANARLEYRHFTSNSNLPEADYADNAVQLSMGVEF